uniref:SOK1 protein n=2 Tax=Kalmanozyma brasiliensis (strain GHG001) TaxID=1365824 RepID=V5GQF4_KALBG
MPRLVRAQSVPNLRAKATLDITAPSHHRLILPSHWAGYVSSHARQGREAVDGSSKASHSRSSKGFPFNVTHYPVGSSSSRSRSTFTPTLHPPITRHTLRELDLFEILKNPQLRHDVVFDPNVQFRPNFDGERGRRKREAGERYWTAVVREIETGCTCTAFSHGQLLPCTCKAKDRLRKIEAKGSRVSSLQQSHIPSRIPLLVQELRTICLSILPSNYPADTAIAEVDEAASASSTEEQKTDQPVASDEASSSMKKKVAVSTASGSSWATTHHQLIAQTLDPHLISQELQHGVLDVPALITFMGSILKLHCAPMRDEAIERMVEVVCVDRNIGKGLRLCFEILELMKLDIANHQLRSARPFLVETAVDFEIRWFKEQIEQGKMSLDRTNAWMQQALIASRPSGDISRSEAVIKAFNHGMLQLIFEVPGSLPLVSPVATPLGSPSSSSLNNTFASHYPETFQFDAYRMMTFHNDVSDLTIVYMLVLLFRQLCSTPLDNRGALPASTGSLVQKQLKTIKGEIWCLVNDANLCLSSPGTAPTTPPAASATSRAAGMDGKLFLGSGGGFVKLDHPRWRRAMQNVLLQVAARAAAVQTAARAGSSDPSTVKTAAPSAATQKVLNSWMDTNLRSGSALHKICQNRLRDVVLGMLGDKVRAGLQSPSSTALPTTTADSEADRLTQKRASPVDTQDESTPSKKPKSDVPVAAEAVASPWDAAMSRAGLEPFAAEIRLLSERIAKVATFHLRVFRNLYEGIQSGRHKCVGGTQ